MEHLTEWYIRFVEMALFTPIIGLIGHFYLIMINRKTDAQAQVGNWGLSISAGLIVIMFVPLGLSLVNIPITRITIAIFVIGFLVLVILRLGKATNIGIHLPENWWERFEQSIIPLTIFFAALGLGAFQTRNAFVPNWYDGLSHTSLLNQFADAGRISPDSIYHVGFHAIAMMFHSISGLSQPETVLLLGQWLVATSGLTLFAMIQRYMRNSYISGLCFIIYIFFLTFPSYLTSIGRYPYLLGFTLLPFAMTSSLGWVTRRAGSYVLAVSFVVALALTHYGALLTWLAFMVSHLTYRMASNRVGRLVILRHRLLTLRRFAYLIAPLGIVVLPKLVNLINHPMILANILARYQEASFDPEALALWEIFLSKNGLACLVWLVWVSWSMVRARWSLYLTLIWPLITWLFIWIQYETIGFSVSTYVNLIIYLSFPLTFAFGFMEKKLAWITNPEQPRISWQGSALISLALFLGLYLAPKNLDPAKSMFTRDDQLAMGWIRNHAPPDSTFLVRTVFWNNSSLIAYDGGGWITLLTGRGIILPQLGELHDLCEFSRQAGVDYMYFGSKPSVNDFDLRLDSLTEENYFLEYQNQTVDIYSFHCP